MYQGGSKRQRRVQGAGRGSWLELDLYRGGGVLRPVGIVGHHDRYGLAQVVHLSGCQDWSPPACQLHGDHIENVARRFRQVFGGEHAQHTLHCPGGIATHMLDHRMWKMRPSNREISLARRANVVRISASAGNQSLILDSSQALTDGAQKEASHSCDGGQFRHL